MSLSRRHFLTAGVASAAASAAGTGLLGFGAPKAAAEPRRMPLWHKGYETAPQGGFDPAPMRLVQGKVPNGLKGTLYRNGPGQFNYGSDYASHWFDGDGLIHRIAIENGQAVHEGRFAQTPKRLDELAAGRFLAPGFGTEGDPNYAMTGPDSVNAANTSVIVINGKLYALWEGGSAYELDPVSLQTIGPKVWHKDLAQMPFLAHPKTEPDGRVWNLGVGGKNVLIYRISAAGVLEDYTMVNIGSFSYIHDWAMTERHLIIMVQPWVSERTVPPFINSFEWKPEDGLKLLIIDKDDTSKRRWAQAPARAFYHTGAAWEEADGTIRLDAALYSKPVLGQDGGGAEIRGEWTPQMDIDSAILTQIIIPPTGDARLVETSLKGDFPQVDPRRHGLRRRLTALASGGSDAAPGASALSVHDWESGRSQSFDFGGTRIVEEFLFVPKPGSVREVDSWLVGPLLNVKTGLRELAVFDAARISDGPVCLWQAAYSWPLGFHGTWV